MTSISSPTSSGPPKLLHALVEGTTTKPISSDPLSPSSPHSHHDGTSPLPNLADTMTRLSTPIQNPLPSSSPSPPKSVRAQSPLNRQSPLPLEFPAQLSVHSPQSQEVTGDVPIASTTSTPAGTLGTAGSRNQRFVSPAGTFPTSQSEGWEEAFQKQRQKRWMEKVEEDLRGWRGGNGAPRSAYTKSAVPTNSYYGQPATGIIGTHLPKEIVRIERDWSEGEVCQFETGFPLELEGRVTPKQWTEFITTLNDHLFQAYSVNSAVLDNLLAIATWWTSMLWRESHFERELRRAELVIDNANRDLFNPAGLNVLSPRELALQFLEIEYY